jgi:dTDP-glucose 4,6-dehydratase
MTILVTGGAGFIGGNFVLDWLAGQSETVVNLDKLTYAGNLQTLALVQGDPRHVFVQGDIGDRALVERLLAEHQPRAVVNFAAESHVDRSIHGPGDFIQTNIVGTFNLLESVRAYHSVMASEAKPSFRFLHVSTDEVYGTLSKTDPAFAETNAYEPNSPYRASKAASDHLVRAWHHTYGLPVVLTNCSNNYGPWQFPEKLIPVVILKAVAGEPIPLYGDGANVRDWLYVDDHVEALLLAATRGRLGESYCVGGAGDHGSPSERTNTEVVQALVKLKSYLDYGTFQPIQIAATVTLNEAPEYPHEVCATYQSRRNALIDGLERIGWSIPSPRGSMFVWAPIPEAYRNMDSVEFCSHLVRECHVALSPGSGFGPGGEGFVRFALIENEQRIHQAVRNLAHGLPKLS